MIDLACLRAERLLERRASGLGAADALILEEHLASCERCNEQARMLSALRSVVNGQNVTLSAPVRQRAIAGAWAGAQAQRATVPRVRSWQLQAGFALVAAALLGFFARGAFLAGTHPALRPSAAVASVPRVAPPTLAAVPDGASLHATSATGPVTFALAHAKVTLRPSSSARWNASQHEVVLSSGSVLVDVDPGPKQPFSVTTPSFRVLVLGTRFSVSLDGVSVERGRVRVVASDARELRVLGAGESFVAADAEGSSHDGLEAPTPSARSEAPHRARVDAAALLSEARTQLAARKLVLARRAIGAALASELLPSEQAEALTLRAECALAAGDSEGGVQAYLRVARSFVSLPAGENALFSAARLDMDRGHTEEGARLLRSYLARYPQGRFVKEAQLRLHTLGAAPHPAAQ